MKHHVHHEYDELLSAAWPSLEIHVQYFCESEVWFEDGNEGARLITIRAEVDGNQIAAPVFPLEEHGSDARKFLALLRESARQSLWAKALKAAKEAGCSGMDDMNEAAENWQRTGKAALQKERGLSTDE